MSSTLKVDIRPKVAVTKFWKQGFLIFRKLFSPEEVLELRRCVLNNPSFKGDLLSNPQLRKLVFDNRLLYIAKMILGGTPWYFGDSNFQVESGPFVLHKDNSDRYDASAPDWNGRYPLIRFGMYTQDHYQHSGGLLLRAGSHNIASVSKGRPVYINTSIGDLVVWNMRITHAGNARQLRWLNFPVINPYLLDKLPSFLYAPPPDRRIPLFVSYGLKGPHYDRHIEYLKTRTESVEWWRHSIYDDAVWEEGNKKPINIHDVEKEIRGVTNLGQNLHYKQLPY